MIESYVDFEDHYNTLNEKFEVLIGKEEPKDHTKHIKKMRAVLREIEALVKNFEFEMHSNAGLYPKDLNKDFKKKKKAVRGFRFQIEEKESQLNKIALGDLDKEDEEGYDEEMMEQKYQLQRSLTKLKEGTDYANGIQEGMVKIKEGLFSAIDKNREMRGEQTYSLSLMNTIDSISKRQKLTFWLVLFFVVTGVILIICNRIFGLFGSN